MRPFGLDGVAAPTGTEARNFDLLAEERFGVAAATLMEAAGRAAALVATRLFPGRRVVALAGPGNNGGDAVVAARSLAAWGAPVSVIHVGRPSDQSLTHGWPLDVRRPDGPADVPSPAGDAVVLDGLLGTGLRGAPRAGAAAWIDWVNRGSAAVLALDVPSGVVADSGAVPAAAVRADATVAFGWPKLGSLLHPARSFAGRLIAVEIGFQPHGSAFAAEVLTPGWVEARLPRREPVTHKNRVGALLLMAGSEGMAGAAVLAGRAALRAGVGLLRIASSAGNREVLQTALPEAIFVDLADRAALADAVASSRACCVGPGLGRSEAAAAALDRVLDDGHSAPVVLDADALTLLARREGGVERLVSQDRPLLLTPHPGELSRLVGLDVDRADPDVALGLARRCGAVVLAKGTPSLVGAPDGRLLVGSLGSSDLAAAGLGDVLAGTAGAFVTQGADPFVAAGLALHTTGRAAVRARRGAGLIPTDVIEALPDALAESGPGHTDVGLPFVIFDQDPAR